MTSNPNPNPNPISMNQARTQLEQKYQGKDRSGQQKDSIIMNKVKWGGKRWDGS
jgi:hypothetical protein